MFVSERPEVDLQYCPRHVLHSLGEKARERPGRDSNQVENRENKTSPKWGRGEGGGASFFGKLRNSE